MKHYIIIKNGKVLRGTNIAIDTEDAHKLLLTANKKGELLYVRVGQQEVKAKNYYAN